MAGFRNYTDFQTILSGVYNFTPRMNLTLRARHYWNKVNYNNFFDVDNNGNLNPRAFVNNVDDNYNVFNIDAFFTWDFRLGSRVIFGWKNWLGDNEVINGALYTRYLKNLDQTFRASHGNELTVKVIYFLDYNQIRKKK